MELNRSSMAAYKRIEHFRIVTGIIAIFAFLLLFLNFFHSLQFVSQIQFYIIFLFCDISIILSMILYAVYAFTYYGIKQSNFFRIALLLFAVGNVLVGLRPFLRLLDPSMNFGPQLYDHNIYSILSLLIGVIYFVIALRHFNKPMSTAKILSIFALIPIGLSFILLRNLLVIVNNAPFILFILYCPQDHKRVKIDISNSQLQEQKMIMGDINSQLLYLKSEFESGKITQQEYDYKRKSLVDRL